MTSDLTFQESHVFEAPIENVFDALWAQPGGNVLELRHITGTPRSIGHRQQLRTAYGGVDLLMIETVTALARPSHLRVVQQPDGFKRHDPVERDIPFLDSLTEDLDAAFVAQFGNDPAATQIDFDLKSTDGVTQVVINISVLTEQRVWWLRRRRWRKSVAKDVADIVSGISSRL